MDILRVFIIIIAFFALYYFFKNRENMVPERKVEGFIPSKKFIGAKKGYVFKKDTKGLGYYIDI